MSINIRPATVEDYPKIDEIFERCHSDKPYDPPRIRNSVTEKVAVDSKGTILAYGVITLFAEGALVLDNESPSRAIAAHALIREALHEAKRAGIERLYLIADSPEYARLLKKHFGAQNCTGELLVVFTGDDNGLGE